MFQTLENKLFLVYEAINKGLKIRIMYTDRDGAQTERDVKPELLDIERLQFKGFCHLRGAERTFALERVLYVKVHESADASA